MTSSANSSKFHFLPVYNFDKFSDMEVYQNRNVDAFKEFLHTFCLQHGDQIPETESFPPRSLTFFLTEAEIEGEVLAWTRNYLRLNKCPDFLCVCLARAICDEVLQWSVDSYLEDVDISSDKQHEEEKGRGEEEETLPSPVDPTNPVNCTPTRLLNVRKFSRQVLSCLHGTCARWRDELPPLDLSHFAPNTISDHAIKNTRRKMEDRYVVLPHLNELFSNQDKPCEAYYAVFDGHGGCEAATYASQHLHRNIVRHPLYATDIETAIREGFLQTDRAFIDKAKHEGLRSGTTCVCTFVREGKLHYAWLGDSQILLVKNGQPVPLMEPHKPEREDEKKRIEDMGGCVIWYGAWRVNGSLSVSRAIGDRDFKPCVSNEPELGSYTLTGDEDYVVLACDGLWDVINYEQLAQLVAEHVTKTDTHHNVAHILVKAACNRGSSDNITVIVVFLRGVERGSDVSRPACENSDCNT